MHYQTRTANRVRSKEAEQHQLWQYLVEVLCEFPNGANGAKLAAYYNEDQPAGLWDGKKITAHQVSKILRQGDGLRYDRSHKGRWTLTAELQQHILHGENYARL